MLIAFTAIILLLCAAIVFLTAAYRRISRMHERHVEELNDIIVELAANQEDIAKNLRFSDDLMSRLSDARQKIDRDLIDVQHDMIEIIGKKNNG